MIIVTDAVAPQEAVIPKKTHDGEEDAVHEFTLEVCSEKGRRRASNVVTQMKFKPRLRKASAARASPYTNPLHGRKGPKRARRCLAVGKKAIGGTTEKVGMIPTVGDIIQNDATTDYSDECGIRMGGKHPLRRSRDSSCWRVLDLRCCSR